MNAISIMAEAPPAPRERRQLGFIRTNAWPVLWRELRSEARKRSNFALRMLGAAGLTILFTALLRDQTQVSATFSAQLFASSHTLLLGAIWLIGPVLTADAISRERREGTLNLLFSTPLTARAILLGKGFVHMIRLVTLWLAAFPVLTIPLLFGGVTRLDLLSAFALHAASFLFTAFFSMALPLLGPELSAGFLGRIAALEPWFLSIWPSLPGGFGFVYLALGTAQLTIAAGAWRLLQRNLERRSFALGQAA